MLICTCLSSELEALLCTRPRAICCQRTASEAQICQTPDRTIADRILDERNPKTHDMGTVPSKQDFFRPDPWLETSAADSQEIVWIPMAGTLRANIS